MPTSRTRVPDCRGGVATPRGAPRRTTRSLSPTPIPTSGSRPKASRSIRIPPRTRRAWGHAHERASAGRQADRISSTKAGASGGESTDRGESRTWRQVLKASRDVAPGVRRAEMATTRGSVERRYKTARRKRQSPVKRAAHDFHASWHARFAASRFVCMRARRRGRVASATAYDEERQRTPLLRTRPATG